MKMFRFVDLPIKTKLLTSAFITFILFVISVILVFNTITNVTRAIQLHKEAHDIFIKINKLQNNFEVIRRSLGEIIIGEKESIENYSTSKKEILLYTQTLNQLKNSLSSNTISNTTENNASINIPEATNIVIENMPVILQLADAIIDETNTNNSEKAVSMYKNIDSLFNVTNDAVSSLSIASENLVQQGLANILMIQQKLQIVFATVFIITLVVNLYISLTVAMSISTSISNISAATIAVSEGNLSTRIPILSNDEIGKLAITFNSMTTKLQDTYKDLEKRVEDRTSELQIKLKEVEEINKLMVNRELKMAKLKEEIEELKKQVKPS